MIVDIFKCFNCVTGGDVVLVIQAIRAIARGPNTFHGRLLGLRVNFNALYLVKFKEAVEKRSVWYESNLDEDARN